MGALNDSYLPPEEFRPQVCKLLPELEYPQQVNLADELLDRNLAAHGDKVAIYFDDERISYRELAARVNRFANALRGLGVGKDDRVVLRALNIPEYLVWNFACWRIGAIPVLVSHLNRAPEVAFKINDSEAVAICVDEHSFADVHKALPECPQLRHVIVHGADVPGTHSYARLCAGQPEQAASADTSRLDIARIIYSSGTTGKPKGILTTIEGILSISDTHGRHILKVRPDDVLGGHPYFSFAFGAGTFLYIPWRFGAAISIVSQFDPRRQFELIDEHGITLLFAVPTAFRMLLGVADAAQRYRLTSLRLSQSAGEPLPEATVREWRARFGQTILNSLGSGELHYWLTTREGMPEDKLGSSGLSEPGYENVVVDENLNPVPPGVPGELITRGPLGQMYWRRPDAQKKGVCPPDSRYAGWSRPGLCFVQDADGYFWFKSRTDDMIVTAGYKVPGGEVEEALNSHPAVLEAVAIGVPDGERGNVIKAFVVLREGRAASAKLAQELQDFVKQTLEPYKYPRQLEFTRYESLPRTATGKVQRNALRDSEVERLRERQAASAQFVAKVRQAVDEGLDAGLFCAESVAVALARAQGVDAEPVSRMATALCCGMAHTGGACGALTGAVLGVSLALGRSQAGQPADKAYAATQRLVRAFEQEFGARDCRALLGCDIGTPEGQAQFHKCGLHERCDRYTARSAELAAELIAAAQH